MPLNEETKHQVSRTLLSILADVSLDGLYLSSYFRVFQSFY